MNTDNEKVQAALDIINARISSIETDKEWLAYLSFQSKFYSYSALNAILIWCQNKESSYVMGFKAWNKLGRSVKKGECAIKIFAPIMKTKELMTNSDTHSCKSRADCEVMKKKVLAGFHLVSVFDISQTAGDDEKLPILISGLSSINPESEQCLYKKLRVIVSKKLPVIETHMKAKGSYNLITNEINIRDDISPLHKLKTLIHEWAHFIDYTRHPESNISRNKRELVAESVAYVVSLSLGIDTADYSVGYLKSWMKDNDEVKQVTNSIQKISNDIIHEIAQSEKSIDTAVSS